MLLIHWFLGFNAADVLFVRVVGAHLFWVLWVCFRRLFVTTVVLCLE